MPPDPRPAPHRPDRPLSPSRSRDLRHRAPGSHPGIETHGHRGARGLRPENTLPAFSHALHIGVHGLELDVTLSADGAVVTTHDPYVSPFTCHDTAPHEADDPHFPYVGRAVADLTLGRLKTLDCGRRMRPGGDSDAFAHTQLPVPGARMPTLDEVIGLLHRRAADTVRLTVELKTDPTHPNTTAAPDTLTARVADVLDAHDMAHRSTVQSFDWRILAHAADRLPAATRAALLDATTWYPGSPWLAGFDPAGPGDAPAARAAAAGAHRLAPEHVLVDAATVIAAHRHGLDVVGWTVNAESDMRTMIDHGVDGIITDYPDRLRAVLATRGLPLPVSYPEPTVACGDRPGENTGPGHNQPLRRNPR